MSHFHDECRQKRFYTTRYLFSSTVRYMNYITRHVCLIQYGVWTCLLRVACALWTVCWRVGCVPRVSQTRSACQMVVLSAFGLSQTTVYVIMTHCCWGPVNYAAVNGLGQSGSVRRCKRVNSPCEPVDCSYPFSVCICLLLLLLLLLLSSRSTVLSTQRHQQ